MFLIAHRGRGLWVLYSLFMGTIAAAGLLKLAPDTPTWLFALLAFLLPGILCVTMGVRARSQPARQVVDPPTGRESKQRPLHSLYWIRIEYWGALFLIFGAWVCTLKPHPGGAGADFAVGNNDTAKAEIRGLPSVDALPPVVPEAHGRASVAEVTGPRKPHVAWGVALPFSGSSTIQVIGGDGTVYLSSYDGLGAARDGKLIWAFHAPEPRVTMADDGRIWFPAPGGGGYFCLNRAGQGGCSPDRSSRRPMPERSPAWGAAETGGG
jgi:hypothetical protein